MRTLISSRAPDMLAGVEDRKSMVKIPPPAWALLFLALTAAINYFAGWPTVPYLKSLPVGLTLIALGFILSHWAFVTFLRAGTQLLPTSKTNSRLVTAGPFRFTRNPMYLGLVVISVGVAVTSGALAVFAAPFLTFVTINWLHIPFEEAKMRRQFGEAFDSYTRAVRRWI